MRHRWQLTHIRFINTPGDSGGQGADPPASGDTEDPQDWKTKYEDAIKHSRDWEKRAKDNKSAADELKQLKDANLSDQEKTSKRMKELETENAAYKTAQQQSEWKTQVSKDTGIPAELLHGDTIEAMKDNASKLNDYIHPKPKAPGVPGQGKTPSKQPSDQQKRDWINKLFGNE
jgi:hypothetical protein